MCKNKFALNLGYLFAAAHLIWAILVAIMPNQLQTCLDWMFNLHGIAPVWTITGMTLVNAIVLVIVTFIVGYILGLILSWAFCCCDNPKKKK